jgi:ABC-type maltose transport system permease subunit
VANLFQRFRLVIAPLALPGLGAAGFFAFISAWGDFLMPLIFLSSSELQMLPLGLFRAFLRVQQIDYGFLSALCRPLHATGCDCFWICRSLFRPDVRRRRQRLN